MKLLSKNEILQIKNAERARDIAEGLKLSRRVDSLRELSADEERALDKFRNESLAAIQKEIDDISKEKDTLNNEVLSLRKEISIGKRDIVKKESLLEKLSVSLESRRLILESKDNELKDREVRINDLSKQINNEYERARTHTDESIRIHKQAEEKEIEKSALLEQARLMKEKIELYVKEKNDQISQADSILSKREHDITQREKHVEKQLHDISVEKKQLDRQRKTLERAMERLKNK